MGVQLCSHLSGLVCDTKQLSNLKMAQAGIDAFQPKVHQGFSEFNQSLQPTKRPLTTYVSKRPCRTRSPARKDRRFDG
jgi:hypothetical protein